MNTPKNIAIIMDGNGRWAEEKNKPRHEGHKQGVKTLKKIVKTAANSEIQTLTVYAFSTENWKRPKIEVDFLLKLMQQTISDEADELLDEGVNVNFLGRQKDLSDNLIKEIKKIENKSASNQRLKLNIAFNYGGRAEILDAAKELAKAYKDDKVKLEQLKEADFENYLYQKNFKDVELLIRTGGDMRISNFLLWQSAYAELYFTEKFWPDFTEKDLETAVNDFRNRERKFGGLNDGDKNA